MKLPTIEITIDEVIVHGLTPGSQYDFADALEAKLTALIEESAAAAAGWRSRDESSRRTNVVAGSSVPALGEAVAVTVRDVLSDGGRP